MNKTGYSERNDKILKYKIQKIFCFLFGHKFHTMSQITTERSQFGHVKCMRCGYEEMYQYDTILQKIS